MTKSPSPSKSASIRSSVFTWIGVASCLSGCDAQLGGGERDVEAAETAGDSSSSPADSDAPSSGGELPNLDEIDCEALPVDPGEAPLRLLSRREYMNTLETFFGPLPGVEESLPTYIPPSSLGVPRAPISAATVEGLHRASEDIAAQVVAQPELLSALAPCEEGADPVACARNFVTGFVARAYRTTLDAEEDIAAHLALFEAGLAESYEHGIELLLRGVVQSPRFLYQVEIGTSEVVGTSAVQLRGREMAARLSYSLWQAPPDEELLRAADAGELRSEEGVVAQLERLLADPRGQEFEARFLAALTHLDRLSYIAKDADRYPEWESLRGPIEEQAWAFFDHVLHEEGGSLSTLLTTDTVLVDDQLAPYFGLEGAGDFSAQKAPEGRASGLLTLPALLAVLAKADQSSPIHRGVFIREALLCQSPPAPPAEIPPAPDVDSGASTRERLAQHVSEPACAGCHSLIDPVGLGFEHYGALGLYREMDAGVPVDATGELVGTDVDGPFDGAVELGQRLSESESVRQCMTQQWFRYMAHRIETESDLCSLKSLLTDFNAAGQDLTRLASAMVRTDAFRYRRPSDAEIAP